MLLVGKCKLFLQPCAEMESYADKAKKLMETAQTKEREMAKETGKGKETMEDKKERKKEEARCKLLH